MGHLLHQGFPSGLALHLKYGVQCSNRATMTRAVTRAAEQARDTASLRAVRYSRNARTAGTVLSGVVSNALVRRGCGWMVWKSPGLIDTGFTLPRVAAV